MNNKKTNSYIKQSKKDPKFDWRTIFIRNSGGFSSKRILSVIGFLTCVGILIAAFITQKEVPDFAEIMLVCCISLYGIDVVPNFWSKTITKS